MSIQKFTTVAGITPGESKGGGPTLLVLAGLAIAGWLGYEYWWKPKQAEEAAKAKAAGEEKKA